MKCHISGMSAVLAAAVLLSACTKTTTYLAPQEGAALSSRRSATVKIRSGETIVVRQPRIAGGQLEGTRLGGDAVNIALGDIESISLVKNNAWYAYLFGTVIALEAGLAIGAVTAPSPPPVGESCPLVYTYDGSRYILEAEPYGGAISRSLERTEWIPLEHLRPVEGVYRLRMTNELAETEYTDELKLVVVDHGPGSRVVPDVFGRMFAVRKPVPPYRAVDGRGGDVRGELAGRDGRFWESSAYNHARPEKDLRDELVLEFPKPEGARTAVLVADAWTTLAGAVAAQGFLESLGRDQDAFFKEVDERGPAFFKMLNWYANEDLYTLNVQVETVRGWTPRVRIHGGGPFVAKEKAYLFDVGDVRGKTLRLRIKPPAGFWRLDSLALEFDAPPPLESLEIGAGLATDQAGRDVCPPLARNDDVFHEMPDRGDFVDLSFPVPPVQAGLTRSFCLKAAGYYRVHLSADGAPRRDNLDRILTEPGYALRLAREKRGGK